MSIKRINQFPEGSGSLSHEDIFLFMDNPSDNGITKKISLSELRSIILNRTTTTYLLHEYANPSGFSTPTSVTIDGMSYGGGQVVSDSAFGLGSSRITLYSDSIFAMIAVDADVETVYYNGETGSDSSGNAKIVSAGVSNYRGYYSYHNLISGNDPAIQQIVISKSSTMSGSNRSTDTNNDDFTVTGLSGSDVVIVLNLYWAEEAGPEFAASTTVAIQQLIDLVMFDEATPRTNINDIRTAFYDNSTTIRTAIENEENDLLYDEFEFYRSFQKVTPSGGSGLGAVLEIGVNDNIHDNGYDNEDVLVPGTGYQVSDTLTVSGDLLGGATPTNDVTITVNSINGTGGIISYSVAGTSISTLWPNSYIIDGEDDQYDIGNFIGTNRTRSTATVTLTYDPIEDDGDEGNDIFQILTVLSTNKTISEGQWVWFEDQNDGAFINHTLSTITSSDNFQISSVDLHNGGVQTAQVLQFDDTSKQSVITGPTPPLGTDSQRIIIQGQRAVGGGEGGDVYVWGGDSDANGGDIKIYAGDADNVSPDNGDGGYVNIDGGAGATTGGNIEITGGYSEDGQAGDVNIVGGPTPSGIGGDVNIITNNNVNNWIFSVDGSLSLPTSGNITFPDSTTQTSAGIPSNTGLVTNSTSISNIVSISQANYDALATKDPNTLYIVNG
jgi:hypothetical protein